MLGVCNHRTMEVKTRMILEKFCPDCLWHMKAIPIEKLIEAFGIEIEYQYLTKDGQKILGKLICTDGVTPYYDMDQQKYLFLEVHANTIFVEAQLLEQENQGRYHFTLAHELAHWILHREEIVSAQNEAAFIDGLHNTRMEKQADYFASALFNVYLGNDNAWGVDKAFYYWSPWIIYSIAALSDDIFINVVEDKAMPIYKFLYAIPQRIISLLSKDGKLSFNEDFRQNYINYILLITLMHKFNKREFLTGLLSTYEKIEMLRREKKYCFNSISNRDNYLVWRCLLYISLSLNHKKSPKH